MSDERRIADIVGQALQPKAMDRSRQLAFRRAVEERLERRSAVRWGGGLALAASAAIAGALWLANPPAPTSEMTEIVRQEAPVPEEQTEASLLAAFADPDEAVEDAGASEDYLPDDYFMLASVVYELDE